jgi:hypothetical protein
MVTLNVEEATARVVLELVDQEAERLLGLLPTLPPHERALAQRRLQHLGVVKHRLEANLWMPDPFRGPAAWNLPRRPAAERDEIEGQGETPDMFARPRRRT